MARMHALRLKRARSLTVTRASVLHTSAFEDQLAELESDDLFERIVSLEEVLRDLPDMGSPLVRDSLIRRYGANIRKLGVGRCLLVYRHVDDEVRMLGIIAARAIR